MQGSYWKELSVRHGRYAAGRESSCPRSEDAVYMGDGLSSKGLIVFRGLCMSVVGTATCLYGLFVPPTGGQVEGRYRWLPTWSACSCFYTNIVSSPVLLGDSRSLMGKLGPGAMGSPGPPRRGRFMCKTSRGPGKEPWDHYKVAYTNLPLQHIETHDHVHVHKHGPGGSATTRHGGCWGRPMVLLHLSGASSSPLPGRFSILASMGDLQLSSWPAGRVEVWSRRLELASNSFTPLRRLVSL